MTQKPADHDEFAAFRDAMADVRQRPDSARVHWQRSPPKPRPRFSEADERQVLHELAYAPLDYETMECGETLTYRAEGIQDSVWRRLRRGNYRIGAEIDLHGLNRQRAQLAVQQFLADCQDRDIRCVRIIHGKGNGSPNSGPILKTLVAAWLRRRRDVLAFCSAQPQDGGTGAVYVLLRAGGNTAPAV